MILEVSDSILAERYRNGVAGGKLRIQSDGFLGVAISGLFCFCDFIAGLDYRFFFFVTKVIISEIINAGIQPKAATNQPMKRIPTFPPTPSYSILPAA